MKKFVSLILFSVLAWSAAHAASGLLDEFRRREKMRLSLEAGNAMSFLKAASFPTDKVEEIEVVDATGAFVVRDHDDMICFGRPSTVIRCKNAAGITKEGFADEVGDLPANSSSSLLTEFLRRNEIKLTAEQEGAVHFLRHILKPAYSGDKIQELEVVSEDGAFVMRELGDVVCYGAPANSMLRCRNKAGLSTIFYQGDAD